MGGRSTVHSAPLVALDRGKSARSRRARDKKLDEPRGATERRPPADRHLPTLRTESDQGARKRLRR